MIHTVALINAQEKSEQHEECFADIIALTLLMLMSTKTFNININDDYANYSLICGHKLVL